MHAYGLLYPIIVTDHGVLSESRKFDSEERQMTTPSIQKHTNLCRRFCLIQRQRVTIQLIQVAQLQDDKPGVALLFAYLRKASGHNLIDA